jgi:hypothetical protein
MKFVFVKFKISLLLKYLCGVYDEKRKICVEELVGKYRLHWKDHVDKRRCKKS